MGSLGSVETSRSRKGWGLSEAAGFAWPQARAGAPGQVLALSSCRGHVVCWGQRVPRALLDRP